MKYRKLDAAGDYTLGTGADFYINQPEAVGQAVITALLLYTGEWFLDLTDGTPWRTEVLGKYTQSTYDTILQQRILNVTGVTGIVSYSSSLNRNTRALTVNVTIDTIYGQTTLSTPI